MSGVRQSASCIALSVALGWAATASAQEVPGDTSTAPIQTAPNSQTGAPPTAAQTGESRGGTLPQKPTASNATQVQEVVVTGSHIARPNNFSVAPITTVTSDEIVNEGAVNVSDVLNRLPQVEPDNQTTYQDGNGQQQIQLRGLGFNRTLSLVDGQRLATAEGVNINALPTALIDRIDILTGGAASVYGADAVAGVVNFILKRDYEGLQLNISSGIYTHNNNGTNIGAQIAQEDGVGVPRGEINDGGSINISAALGHNFFDNRFNVEGFASYVKTDAIKYSDRDYSACNLTQSAVNTVPTCSSSSFASKYGVFAPGDNFGGTTYSLAQNGSQNFTPTNSTDTSQIYRSDDLQQESYRYNGGVFLNYKITPNHSAYFNYLISDSVSLAPSSQPVLQDASDYGFSQPYTTNCNNPLLSAQQLGVVCGAQAGTAASVPIGIRESLDGFGASELRYNNLDQRISAGVRGEFLDKLFAYDVDMVLSRGATREYGFPADAPVNYTNLEYSLNNCVGAPAGCVPLNIFSPAGAGGSKALTNYLFPLPSGHSTNTGTLYDYNANLTTDLGKVGIRSPFAKEGIKVAIGAEFREDREVNSLDQAEVLEQGGSNFSLSQNVKEAYLEANIPLIQDDLLTHQLLLTGSHRWSKYAVSPDIFTTWEVGGAYSPVADVTFRASYNKASREPTVYEYGSNVFSYGGGGGPDPCAGSAPTASLAACELTGVTPAEYGNIAQCANNDCLARSGGVHPDPETAHTLTFGAIFKPRFIPRLVLSVDRYDIRIDDQIGFAYPSEWTNGCIDFANSYYCSHIVRNPNGTLTSGNTALGGATPSTGFIYYGTLNEYEYYAKGIDFQAQYNIPAPAIHGRVDIDMNGSLVQERGGRDGFGDPVRNDAGYFSTFAGQPQPAWRSNTRATYTTDDKFFAFSVNWRYISGVEATANSGEASLGAGPTGFQQPLTLFGSIKDYNYFDTSITFNIHNHYKLTILTNNIFDLTPPIIPGSRSISNTYSNTIPQLYDSLGRYVGMNLSADF